MRRLGPARAVAVVRDNPRFGDVLVEERKTALVFYTLVQPAPQPAWDAYYAPWARITPVDPAHSRYRLECMRYKDKWEALPFEGSLEDCVWELDRDPWHVFFNR